MGTEQKRLSEHGLQSERLLWLGTGRSVFENEVAALETQLGLTTFGKLWAWVQTHSMWPDLFGTSCCTIEMMAVVGARHDIARFGMEFFRASPRQADLLIVPGRVSHKLARPLRQIYDQMLEPKWVIAMGACASSGGMFNNYAVVQASTASSRSTSTSQGVRRGRRPCSRGSRACTRRSEPAFRPPTRSAEPPSSRRIVNTTCKDESDGP